MIIFIRLSFQHFISNVFIFPFHSTSILLHYILSYPILSSTFMFYRILSFPVTSFPYHTTAFLSSPSHPFSFIFTLLCLLFFSDFELSETSVSTSSSTSSAAASGNQVERGSWILWFFYDLYSIIHLLNIFLLFFPTIVINLLFCQFCFYFHILNFKLLFCLNRVNFALCSYLIYVSLIHSITVNHHHYVLLHLVE